MRRLIMKFAVCLQYVLFESEEKMPANTLNWKWAGPADKDRKVQSG